MTDVPRYTPLDLDEQIAHIERAQAETRKFVAEQNKLAAEAAKLGRDYRLAMWTALGSVALGGAALLTAFVTVIRAVH